MAETISSLIDSSQSPKSSSTLPKGPQTSTSASTNQSPQGKVLQTTPNPYGEIDEYLKEWAPKKPLPKPDTRIRMKKKTVNPLDFKEIDDFVAEWGPQTHGRPRTPPPLPPTPPSPKKSTLGCPQAIMQWYMRQKMWVKIALAIGAIAILFVLGGLIYCGAEDCWGSGDGGVETTNIVRISMKSAIAKPITAISNKIFKSTMSLQPNSQIVTGGGTTEDTETTEDSDAPKATEDTEARETTDVTEDTEGKKGSQIPRKPGVTRATTSSVGTIKVLLALVIVVAVVVALIVIYNRRKSAIKKTGAHR